MIATVAQLAAILLILYAGRAAARLLRQPEVIGEICAGLLFGYLVMRIAGPEGLDEVLSVGLTEVVHAVGHAGLALFLVGMAFELRRGLGRIRLREVGAVTAGALALPLAAGAGLAWWLFATGRPELTGTAAAPAFVAMIAISLAVTAVPVLARILAARGLADDTAGTLALGSAVLIDAVAWLLLSVVIGLSAAGLGGVLLSIAVSCGGIATALGARRLLDRARIGALCAAHPGLAVVLTGLLAVAAMWAAGRWGLTEFLGPLLVGLALPADRAGRPPAWGRLAASTGGLGLRLVPALFVVTGITLFAGPEPASVGWEVIALVTVLAMIGKIGGGYLGAVAAGHSPRTGFQVGVLMNARGLTEIVFLQSGYAAGLLSPALYLAFLVMAVVTTAATGPLLSVVDRISASPGMTKKGAVLP
ncbi:cation:proton antiporter [Nonomuraea sp. LPB2021202275-12-8]|uniref:cation:proton antiporter n=1 Tax=Nonomuraea sp. LPB2021202275-12-8 TaxID=3120159 RepID=UPI00300C5931